MHASKLERRRGHVWRGDPTGVLALCHDAAGWRLGEAEAHGNQALPEHVLREIADDVVKAGGRIGPPVKTLGYRLGRHGQGDHYIDSPATDWVDRLELGELWD